MTCNPHRCFTQQFNQCFDASDHCLRGGSEPHICATTSFSAYANTPPGRQTTGFCCLLWRGSNITDIGNPPCRPVRRGLATGSASFDTGCGPSQEGGDILRGLECHAPRINVSGFLLTFANAPICRQSITRRGNQLFFLSTEGVSRGLGAHIPIPSSPYQRNQ